MYLILLPVILCGGAVLNSLPPGTVIPNVSTALTLLKMLQETSVDAAPAETPADDINSFNAEIEENLPDGSIVPLKNFPALPGSVYQITGGNTRNAFEVDGSTGVLTITDGRSLNFEVTPEFRLEITAEQTDPDADQFREEFIASLLESGAAPNNLPAISKSRQVFHVLIQLRDNPEAPSFQKQHLSIDENSQPHTVLGAVTASDEDKDDRLTYSIVSGNEGSRFEIDESTGMLRIGNAVPDFEQRSEFQLHLRAVDRNGLSANAQIKVSVTDTNEPPRLENSTVNLSPVPVSGDFVGRIAAVDPDCEDSLTYHLTDDPSDGGFSLDAFSGDLRICDPLKIQQWNPGEYRLTVQATDREGMTCQAVVTLQKPTPSAAPALMASLPESGTVPQNNPAEALPATTADTGDAGISEAAVSVNAGGMQLILMAAGLLLCGISLPLWLLCRRKRETSGQFNDGETIEQDEEARNRQLSAAADNLQKSAIDQETGRQVSDVEQRLLLEIEQLRLELLRVQQASHLRTSALEQQNKEYADCTEVLEAELSRAREGLKKAAEIVSKNQAFEEEIRKLRSEAEERRQIIESLKHRLEYVTASADGPPEPITHSSEGVSARFDSSDPWDNFTEDDEYRKYESFSESTDRPFSAREESSLSNSEHLDARHRLERAKEDLVHSLPAWYTGSAPVIADRADEEPSPVSETQPSESGNMAGISNLRAELAGLFDLKKRAGFSDAGLKAAPPIEPAELSRAEESEVDNDVRHSSVSNEFDHFSAKPEDEHDDYVRQYMSKLLNRKDDPAAISASQIQSEGGHLSDAERQANDRRTGDRRASDRRNGGDSTADPSVPRPKIDVVSLRHKTNSFREIALHSAEKALATHTLRKARSGLTVRFLLLAVLVISALVFGTASVLNVMQVPLLNWLMGVLIVGSLGELAVRLHRLYWPRKISTATKLASGSDDVQTTAEANQKLRHTDISGPAAGI